MSYTIMVVDDDADIRHLLQTMLSLSGYQTNTAVDGLDAWNKIQTQCPDALVVDVMMPNLDGVSLCKRLRDLEETVNLPIIILSGKAHPEAVREGLAAGADRYLTKPMSFDELTKNLTELLQGTEQRRPIA